MLGSDPPPPPRRQPQPKPPPGTATKEGEGGGLGKWASVPSPPRKAIFFPPSANSSPVRRTHRTHLNASTVPTPHRRMFGTLVVQLPCDYEGGLITVKHGSITQKFALDAKCRHECAYVAFYADCWHEVHPLRKGHRLCVVYNLVRTSPGVLPQVKDNERALRRMRRALRCWAQRGLHHKLVILTKHKYTVAGLREGSGACARAMKGHDRVMALFLELAQREKVDVDWTVGIVKKEETGEGECDYGYRHRYWHRWDSDGSDSDCDGVWGETHEVEWSLHTETYGGLSIAPRDSDDDAGDLVVPDDYFDTVDPDEVRSAVAVLQALCHWCCAGSLGGAAGPTLYIDPVNTPRVQRMPCPTNTSIRTVIF